CPGASSNTHPVRLPARCGVPCAPRRCAGAHGGSCSKPCDSHHFSRRLLPVARSAVFGGKKTTVGLDIGSGLIKVAVVDHSRREPELVRVTVTPLLADAIVEGEVMDPGIVAEAIQTALSEAGVKAKDVVTAVGGRDVIIKKIQIERVKEQQARELMRWEAEQHVPFDMESVELDFQILDPDADGVEMSVLLVAAKRDLIESKIRMLTDAGLAPGVVDVEAFALHNAFEVNHPDAMNG